MTTRKRNGGMGGTAVGESESLRESKDGRDENGRSLSSVAGRRRGCSGGFAFFVGIIEHSSRRNPPCLS